MLVLKVLLVVTDEDAVFCVFTAHREILAGRQRQ